MTSKIEKLEKLLIESKANWSSPELYNSALAILEIVRAAKNIRSDCGELEEALQKFEESEL